MAQKSKTHLRERWGGHSGTFDYRNYLERPLKIYRTYASLDTSLHSRYSPASRRTTTKLIRAE